MAALGDAYVDVHANTKPFAREIAPQLRAALAAAEGDADAVGARIGRKITNGAEGEVRRSGRRVGRALSEEVDKGFRGRLREARTAISDLFRNLARGNFIVTRLIGSAFQRVGQAISKVIDIGKDLGKLAFDIFHLFDTLIEGAAAVGKAVFGIGQDFSKVGSSIGAALAQVGSSLFALVAEAPMLLVMVAIFAAMLIPLTAILGALIAVTAVFADLLGFALALPAALAVLLGIVLPLVVAMHNLGDAIELVFEKDPEKLQKGLEKLSPTLQGLVKELRSLRPEFDKLVNGTQQAFFGGFLKDLGPTIKSLMPTLQSGFAAVGREAGKFIDSLLKGAQSPEVRRFLLEMLGEGARALGLLSGPMTELIKSFGIAAEAALPFIDDAIIAFGDFITNFATWLTDTVEDGRFQTFLDNATESLKVLITLVGSLSDLLFAMFQETNEDGREFLGIITGAIQEFTAWINSPDGKEGMAALGALAIAFAISLAGALKTVEIILDLLGQAYVLYRKINGTYSSPSFSATTNVGGPDTGQGYFHGYANGGIIGADQLAMLHSPEVVIPLNNPQRAQQLALESGLMDMMGTSPEVNVYIGNERLAALAYTVSTGVNRAQARSLRHVPRAA